MLKPFLLLLSGCLIVVVVLEGLFRLLPVSTATRTGYYINQNILTYPAKHCFRTSFGWDLRNPQRHCANNYGFIANKDFHYDPDAIVLVGDSFVEANMLPVHQGLAAQIESRLKDKIVFALGGPGSNLLDYSERVQFARKNFGSKVFVIVINRTDVRESICGSGNIHAHCIDANNLLPKIERLHSPSKLKLIFRESSFAQYVFSQIRVNVSNFSSRSFNSSPTLIKNSERPKASITAEELIIRMFFSRLPAGDGVKYIFVFDPDRSKSDSYEKKIGYIDLLKNSANKFGVDVIDPESDFIRFKSLNDIALEVSPTDQHWNSEAIKIVANLVADRLN